MTATIPPETRPETTVEFTPAERAELGDRLAMSNCPVCGGPSNGGCVCQVPDKVWAAELTASQVAALLATPDYEPLRDPVYGGDVFARVAAGEVA